MDLVLWYATNLRDLSAVNVSSKSIQWCERFFNQPKLAWRTTLLIEPPEPNRCVDRATSWSARTFIPLFPKFMPPSETLVCYVMRWKLQVDVKLKWFPKLCSNLKAKHKFYVFTINSGLIVAKLVNKTWFFNVCFFYIQGNSQWTSERQSYGRGA